MEPIFRFSELTWNLFYVPHNVVGWAKDVLNHRVFSNQRCEAAGSGLGLTPNFAKNKPPGVCRTTSLVYAHHTRASCLVQRGINPRTLRRATRRGRSKLPLPAARRNVRQNEVHHTLPPPPPKLSPTPPPPSHYSLPPFSFPVPERPCRCACVTPLSLQRLTLPPSPYALPLAAVHFISCAVNPPCSQGRDQGSGCEGQGRSGCAEQERWTGW